MAIRKWNCLFVLCIIPLWLITVAGCKPGLIGPETVPPQNRIALADESDSGAWDTDDLVVSYHYQRRPEALDFSGKVEFFGKISGSFEVLERFSLTLYLLDEAGDIIESKALASSGYYKEIKPIPFSKTIPLPAGATGFAFGYSGKAVSGGSEDEGGSSWQFWETPGD